MALDVADFASPPNSITLKTVIDSYILTPYSFANLDSKFYYTSPKDPTTAIKLLSTNSINLGNFRGKYITSIGTLASVNHSDSAARDLHGVAGNIGFNGAKVKYRGDYISELSLNFYANAQHQGSAVSAGTNSEVIVITGIIKEETTKYAQGGLGVYNVIFAKETTGIIIAFQANMSNNLGLQKSFGKTLNYTIKSDGTGLDLA